METIHDFLEIVSMEKHSMVSYIRMVLQEQGMGWEVRARARIPAPILGMSLGEAFPSWRWLGDTHGFPWRAWGTPGAVGSGVTLGKKARKGEFGMGRGGGEPGCPSRNGDGTSIPEFWDHP